MKDFIVNIIVKLVNNARPAIYRAPLIGYASAKDEVFLQTKAIVGEKYILPEGLLPGAKTVVAFFLPFKKEIVFGNRQGNMPSRQWAQAYQTTNNLINNICRELNSQLAEKGVKSAWLLPTYEFDQKKLMAQWSHKHAAFACGLGTFGRNQLFLTARGCAGRIGSMVLDIELAPDTRNNELVACIDGCKYCMDICPVGALSNSGFDRHKCFAHCQAADNSFPDLDCVEVCGKCSTGPCAFLE